jgi:hypothetical protein
MKTGVNKAHAQWIYLLGEFEKRRPGQVRVDGDDAGILTDHLQDVKFIAWNSYAFVALDLCDWG